MAPRLSRKGNQSLTASPAATQSAPEKPQGKADEDAGEGSEHVLDRLKIHPCYCAARCAAE